MEYNLKVILNLIANYTAKADSLEEVYNYVASAAGVDGTKMPSFGEAKAELAKLDKEGV